MGIWILMINDTKKKESGFYLYNYEKLSRTIEFLEKIGCPAYKVASPEITDVGLIETLSTTGKPIILSTGVANKTDLDLAVNTIRKKHCKFAILKCTSAYPAPNCDLNLNIVLVITLNVFEILTPKVDIKQKL